MSRILLRKAKQLAADPTLLRFLVERALGRVAKPRAFTPGHPPYLASLALGSPPAFRSWPETTSAEPQRALTLPLPGASVTLEPGEAARLFDTDFPDLETRLALHRFAWLPLVAAEPAWVVALWREWAKRFGWPEPGWEWHPYTAAERAINLLAFARRHGLPGPADATLALLAAHGPAIASRLEYGGEHYTGNHLANDGRGLYLLGLELGWEACAGLGRDILLNEADRIFLPTGMLREGSSHYQLLLARGYLSAWLAARRHHRTEAATLAGIARRALGAAQRLALPGGLPLVGDISPDCPPAFLACLLPGGDLHGGWGGLLDDDERAAVAQLRDGAAPEGGSDGWLKAAFGEWAGLWYAAPQGWPFMPGHGHQDLGACELHWRGVPLFIDPGRGGYGESGPAALYRSAAVHSTLHLDGADPTPPNKPYYDDAFRARAGGGPPRLDRLGDGVRLTHHGFRRQGAKQVERRWKFSSDGFETIDTVDGGGAPRITRRLVTPWPVRLDGGAALVHTPAGSLRMTADAPLTLARLTRWTAYGEGQPAMAITAECGSLLPWRGRMSVEVV
ncbi:MAG: heparinase II/III family protein [Magnetospirillum sp.]|nr:heparinase II/III family protein [Magnetospirillum sp.]